MSSSSVSGIFSLEKISSNCSMNSSSGISCSAASISAGVSGAVVTRFFGIPSPIDPSLSSVAQPAGRFDDLIGVTVVYLHGIDDSDNRGFDRHFLIADG